MRLLRAGWLLLSSVGACLAQPSVYSIENAASNIPPDLPNAAIAQGAMFIVRGANLGPAEIAVDGEFPLANTLAGTSVRITVSGQTRDGIMHYTSLGQTAAILPSTTPLGTGTLTVTYNGRPSNAFPITVVASNLGLYSLNSSGSGEAVATFQIPPAGGPFLRHGNAAVPNDVVIFWGTGLGAVKADETVAGLGEDMRNVPLEVYVGGKQAEVLYRGRDACCASVDIIHVRIPQGVAGCVTPVTMRIGDLVSNTVTIPVGATSRNCTPTNPAVTQSVLDGITARGSYTAGTVSVRRIILTALGPAPGRQPVTSRNDEGFASFSRVSGDLSAVLHSQLDFVPFGACAVHSYNGDSFRPPALPAQGLDAGASIGVNGPNGTQSILAEPGQTGGYFSNFSRSADYLAPGQHAVTGAGGAGVGTFSVPLTIPPALVWTNASASTTVNRANGLPITWTGGDPNGLLRISGQSYTNYPADGCCSIPVGAHFTCTARIAAGSFTVPPFVLLALPATGNWDAIPGSGAFAGGILLLSATTGTSATAAGLDSFSVQSEFTLAQYARFQ